MTSSNTSDRPWLNQYPAGVPHDIHPDTEISLAAVLEKCLQAHADRPVSVCMERWMSYRELDVTSQALGAWLQDQGLQADDRVAVMLPNIPQFLVAMAAVIRAGFTVVNVNPLYTPHELEQQLKDSGANTIIILESLYATLQAVIGQTQVKHVVVASMADVLSPSNAQVPGGAAQALANSATTARLPLQKPLGPYNTVGFTDAITLSKGKTLKPSAAHLNTIAFLQYTGGTTGLSKGAVLTHRNIVAAMLQAEAWFTPALSKVGDVRKINNIAALPLYHIFALTLSLVTLRWGAHLTLVPNPRDIPGFVDTLKQRPFHMLPAVNTLFNGLLHNPQFRELDFSSLAVSQAGGMAATEATAKEWQKVTGSTMIEGWGMSETCAIGTNNPINSTGFSGNIGLPLPSIRIAIKDDDGNTLPLGESGEICIHGPNVMTGYYNQPDETARAFTPDGYMRTGDVGIMDPQGFTRIVDRKKDMILVSGFNVFPTELENVVSSCPGVLECAAIGLPDERQGEVIKIFVVRSDPTLTEEQVAQHCHDNLTGYKRPKYIEFRDALPKTNVGKILRRELRPKA